MWGAGETQTSRSAHVADQLLKRSERILWLRTQESVCQPRWSITGLAVNAWVGDLTYMDQSSIANSRGKANIIDESSVLCSMFYGPDGLVGRLRQSSQFQHPGRVKAMSLDPEFKKHLHSLMVEVYEKTVDETEQHKRELLFKARQHTMMLRLHCLQGCGVVCNGVSSKQDD